MKFISIMNFISEMESEPESIFIRVRRRRLLKVRERMRIHQRIEQSVNANKIGFLFVIAIYLGSSLKIANKYVIKIITNKYDEVVFYE